VKLGVFSRKDGSTGLFSVAESGYVDLGAGGGHTVPRTLLEAVGDRAALETFRSLTNRAANVLKPSETHLAAPLVNPSRSILCVGRNYLEHIEEGNRARGDTNPNIPKVPIFFSKLASTVTGTDGSIVSWPETKEIDYEGELAVVIGKKIRSANVANAREAVFGYTLLNDVSARDLQRAHNQWFKGKNLDTFCPLGPWIVTADEIGWPVKLQIRLTVNGEVRQNFNTQDMVFDIPTIISELSKGMTLYPGDMIATGTGPGCAFAMNPPPWLKPGDVVEVYSEKIGTLRSTVVKPLT
jgi:2-keto-4-pentenoate hydratase/2-oxohepta-3-ene-1,7-dioic acid hydratase in catechol pathway